MQLANNQVILKTCLWKNMFLSFESSRTKKRKKEINKQNKKIYMRELRVHPVLWWKGVTALCITMCGNFSKKQSLTVCHWLVWLEMRNLSYFLAEHHIFPWIWLIEQETRCKSCAQKNRKILMKSGFECLPLGSVSYLGRDSIEVLSQHPSHVFACVWGHLVLEQEGELATLSDAVEMAVDLVVFATWRK